jgi:hypothetical protein
VIELHAARLATPSELGGVTEEQLIALDVRQMHADRLLLELLSAVRQSSGAIARGCDILEKETRTRDPNIRE